MISSSDRLVAVKKAKAVSPGCTRTSRCCGVNFHGRVSDTEEAKVIRKRGEVVIGVRRSADEACGPAFTGCPPHPVC